METASLGQRLQHLSAANRRAFDIERERELLKARHGVGLERLERPGPLEPVPAATTALSFDGPLPCVSGRDLDASIARRAIANHGSLIVRGLVPQPDVQLLVAAIDQVFAACDASLLDGADHDEWFSPFPRGEGLVDLVRAGLRAKGAVLTGDSPHATFLVADVFTAHGIDRLAHDYLGQPPVLALDKWTLRRNERATGIEWHQDGAFLGDDVQALNLWLSLSECGVDAPSLDVIPRRLDAIVATGTEGATYSWSVSDEVASRTAGPRGWHRPQFGPGDALLFDDKLLHRTGDAATMTQTRYAIETWFFAPAGGTSYITVPLVL